MLDHTSLPLKDKKTARLNTLINSYWDFSKASLLLFPFFPPLNFVN